MDPHVVVRDLRVVYGGVFAVDGVSFDVPARQIFAIIGPANAGKTTLLKCVNRTIDFTAGARVEGAVIIDGENVLRAADVYSLRRKVGMVSPLPVGLPLSVHDNVAYAPRLAGVAHRADLDAIVERCLRQAALWDEVKDRLDLLGTRLSGGQQQRLTIARALSHEPEILCLNRFSIAIDPVTTMRIEEVLADLKRQITILLITNIVQQAHRLADSVAVLNRGRLVEVGPTDVIFSDQPAEGFTFDYVRGRFG